MIRDWVNWTWLGDHIVEQHIHHLDAMLWVLGAPPIKRRRHGRQFGCVVATGGTSMTFSVDYEFESGVHLHSTIRQAGACANLRDETSSSAPN